MGLGNRSASRHETVASKAAGVDPSLYWAFQPGQKVMTVDGFAGTVASVNDGPIAGAESYIVTLANGLGGGEYTESQLRAISDATGSVHRTAADDYPELGSVLVDRPDIALNTVLASKTAAMPGDYGDYPAGWVQCPEDSCGQMLDTNRDESLTDHLEREHGYDQDHAWETAHHGALVEAVDLGIHDNSQPKGPHGIESFDELEPNDGAEAGVDEHGHLTWDGASPGCRDTDEYSMFGQNDAVEKQSSIQWETLRGDTRRYVESPDGTRRYLDAVEKHASSDFPCPCGNPGHSHEQHEAWAEANGRDAWGRPVMQAYDGHDAWSCNNYSCTEHPQSMYQQEGEHLQSTPGWLSHDAHPDAEIRRQVNQAMPRLDTEDANWLLGQQRQGPSRLSSLDDYVDITDEKYRQGHFHHVSDEDVRCSDLDHCPSICNHDDENCGVHRKDRGPYTREKFAQNVMDHFDALQHGENPWALISEAAVDPDFRFHVTAAWADVQRKAKRIRAEGGVHLTMVTEGMVHGEVQGDTNVYETGLQRLPGRNAVQAWSCGCKWGAYHWGAADDFSRFAGRMCSHALALQYEAQSRGMFGRTIEPDNAKPSWVPRRVVVKYDIDADRHIDAPGTPMRGDYGLMASLRPVEVLAVHAARTGESYEDTALALAAIGFNLHEAAVNNAWGEPAPNLVQYPKGPTQPPDPNANPASTGWASAPDPEDWGKAGPSGLDHMVASRDDDDAVFEPEIAKEALAPIIPLLLRALPQVVKTVAPKAVGEVIRHHDHPNAGPQVPDQGSGPANPEGPNGEQADEDGEYNPLEYGARAMLNDEPEPALPSTDAVDIDQDSPDSLEPEYSGFVSTGSAVDDIVAQFQATAGARVLQTGSGGGSSDGMDLAAAAKQFLATGETMDKTALKAFTPAEQAAIINEGKDVRTANFDRLDLSGTHYEPLEAALAAAEGNDDDWMD